MLTLALRRWRHIPTAPREIGYRVNSSKLMLEFLYIVIL